MALTPDQIRNVPAGETVGSILLKKNLRRIKRPNEKNKVGFQGKTNKPIEAGVKPISAGYKRQPVEAGVPTFTATPQYRNYIEKPPWERIKIYDVNDQFSTLKEMYRYYSLGSVVHPGLALGVLFSPALNRESIPFLFQGENFRNKLKELSAKYQPETITDLITGLPQRSFVQKRIIDPMLGTAQRGLNVLASPGEVTGRMMKADDYIRFKALDSTLTNEEKRQIGWSGKYDESQIQNYLPDNKMSFSAQKTNPKIAVVWQAMKRPEYQAALEKYGSMSVADTANEYWSGIVRAAKDEKLEETAPKGTTKNVMQTVAARTQFHKNPVLNALMEINTDPTILAFPFSMAAKEGIQSAVAAGKFAKLAEVLPQLEKSQTLGEVALRVGLRSGWDEAASAVKSVVKTPVFRKLADEAGFLRFGKRAEIDEVSNLEGFVREWIRRPQETLKKLGEGGQAVEKKIIKSTVLGEERAARVIGRTKEIFDKLTDAERTNLELVIGNRALPISENVAELAPKLRQHLDFISNVAQKMGLEIYDPKLGYLRKWLPEKDYFPRELDWNLVKKNKAILVKHLLDTKQVKNIDEARKVLSRQRYQEAISGHLEIARTFKLPDKYYIKDPQVVWQRYVTETSKRLIQRQVFGKKYEGIFKDINKIRETFGGEQAEWAQKQFMDYVKQTIPTKDWSAPIRNLHIATKMALSSLQNSTQKISGLLDGNVSSFLKATANYRRKAGREEASATGAIIRNILDDYMGKLGLQADSLTGRAASGVLKITRFSAAEANNRIFEALRAKYQINWAFKKLLKHPNSKRFRGYFEPLVRYFNLDIDKAIRAGKLPNEKLKKVYANINVIQKQFRGGRFFQPPGWTSTSEGKLLTQFKTFIYNQGALIKDSVKAGIKNRNPAPLIALLTVFPAVGQLPAEFFAKIRGRERSWTGKDRIPGLPIDLPAPLARYIEGISYVGGFGIAYDLLQSAEFGEKGIAGTALGPTVSDVAAGGAAGYKAVAKEQPADLAKFLVRQIPAVGGTLKRKIKSNKGKIRIITLAERRAEDRARRKSQTKVRNIVD